jgi:hypothetical protein
MKRSQINILCTLVFVMGVSIGTLMHGHIEWHDIIGVTVATIIFHILQSLSIGRIFKQLFVIRKKD